MSETAPKAPRGPRREATIDYAGCTVSFGGVLYQISDLPESVRSDLALRGLAAAVRAAKTAPEFVQTLTAGNAPWRRETAEKTDFWRDAWSHAVAESRARRAGVKVKAPEYAEILAAARADAEKLGRSELAAARRMPGVVAQYARITGNASDPEALLGI